MTEYCLYCGSEIANSSSGGRRRHFCDSRCRVGHHRREKRYNLLHSNCNETPSLKRCLILELFPGAGLLGKAFEHFGATIVRGPDILWGADVRDFRSISGKFDGIIGGPPCQFASRAAISGTSAENMIPEFVRIVEESKPTWAIMENVREALPYAPAWDYVFLRDWDCGGLTHRRRGFWFYGISAPPTPPKRIGTPEYSVLASNWNYRGTSHLRGHKWLSPGRAAELQGYPDLAAKIIENQPGWKKENGHWNGVTTFSRQVLAIHMIGNGVPRSMGLYLAKYIALVEYERKKRS